MYSLVVVIFRSMYIVVFIIVAIYRSAGLLVVTGYEISFCERKKQNEYILCLVKKYYILILDLNPRYNTRGGWVYKGV